MDDNIFKKYDAPINNSKILKPKLIKMRGHKCEICLNSSWLNKPINLEVHHIDGDNTNNELKNLQLLCPNCHSYTDNYGIKNKKQDISEEEFVAALKANKTVRQALLSLNLSDASGNYKRAYALIKKYNIFNLVDKSNLIRCKRCNKVIENNKTGYCIDCYNLLQKENSSKPDRIILKEKIRSMTFVEIGNQYGVSDNTIRKWCKSENLPFTKKEIKLYSDEEWAKL